MKRIGVLGFNSAPPIYVDPLRARGVRCETVDATLQTALDADDLVNPVALLAEATVRLAVSA